MKNHLLPQSEFENAVANLIKINSAFTELKQNIRPIQNHQLSYEFKKENVANDIKEEPCYRDHQPLSVDIVVDGIEHQVVLEFTKDEKLLQQYYDLREESYRGEWGFEKYKGAEENYDRKSHVLVARVGNEVVGGARLGFSNEEILSNEDKKSGFTYKNAAKIIGIDLGTTKYTEVSALVLKKSFRSNKLLPNLFYKFIKYSKQFGARYMFGTSDMACNRIYVVTFRKLGYSSKIIEEIIAPKRSTYNDIKMFPLLVYLDN